jgi:NADH:ubiquinone oxidoreductase subunit E
MVDDNKQQMNEDNSPNAPRNEHKDKEGMNNTIAIDWQEIDTIIERYKSSHEALLMIMQDISDIYNYLPSEVIPVLVEQLGIKESLIYSVATFYKTISLTPRGKYIISVCTGTACHVRGAEKIMDGLKEKLHITEGQTTDDKLFSLEAVRCLGCCASGPVITVNKETHGGMDLSSAVNIIDQYTDNDSE